MQAPHSFDDLLDDIKEVNTFLAVDVHGVHWFDGEVSLWQLHRHLYNIARIHRGTTHRGIFGRRVINLEKYISVENIHIILYSVEVS